jgi:predicted dehydrogenase
LTIGHQRHYSLLYAHAVEVLNAGELGEVRHIRALWHRNNTWPLLDANSQPVLDERGKPMLRDGWRPLIKKEDREALESKLKQVQYKSMEELVRWRLFNRTGGGLMVELGSHQLDACSIFLGKVHPLAVQGVGGKFFYQDEREANDHIFLTFEFPGKNYFEKGPEGQPTRMVKDKEDIVVVTYSSISTNSFEKYGECVMGNRGTMIVEEEQSVMLFPARDPNKKDEGKATSFTVTMAGGNKPASDSSSTAGIVDPVKAQATGSAALSGAVSRGYREEMEHFAVCVRLLQKAEKQKASKEEMGEIRLAPRCHGKVAMADAIIALTSNLAMKKRQRIEFKEEWFDPRSAQVPDADMNPEVV